MMDFGARRACTLVAGVSGSGKTTFCLRYLVHDRSLGLRLVWDADGQLASRLGLPAATTAQELSMAVEDGWVVYDPNVMFPGRHSEDSAGSVGGPTRWPGPDRDESAFWSMRCGATAPTRPSRRLWPSASRRDGCGPWIPCSPFSGPTV